MRFKLHLSLLSGLAGLTAFLLFAGKPAPSASNGVLPNLLLITIDTLRADHLGCYGYRSIQTPVIDALAAEGVLYENCIAQSPMTLPSHCTILTGTYPQFHGVRDNIAFSLDPKIPTIAELLKSRGYATALSGKWQLSGKLPDDVMRKLNNAVDGAHRPPARVAAEFLKSVGR